MSITGANLIGGRPSREGRETFTNVNPHTGEAGQQLFYNSTPDEIQRAVRASSDAYQITRNMQPRTLADFLEGVADEIEALGDALLEVGDWETGLGIPRLAGERARTTDQLRKFGELLREGSYVEAILDTVPPLPSPSLRPSLRRMLFPIGPVAVFAASNFPFAFSVAGGDTASAWAAGCPVVVKAHPGHPATSEWFGLAINRAIRSCDFPAGFFSLLQGENIEVGQNLVKAPGIAAVAFTGSLRAGRAIYNLAASRPKPIPVYAEMGSINPVIILPGAADERAEEILVGLTNSATAGTGQFCTNPGLVLMLDDEQTQRFVGEYVEKMNNAPPGVLLNEKIESGLAQAVQETLSHPAVECLVGGKVIGGQTFSFEATVMQTTSEAFRQNEQLQKEHFGPATLFVLCPDFEDLLTTAELLPGSLTATVHAGMEEFEAAAQLYDKLREKAGRLIWNGFPTGVEVAHAMQHGGPYPATTAPATTSVGMMAIKRFLRPVAFQNMPDELLPKALQDENPLGIWRMVDGTMTRG